MRASKVSHLTKEILIDLYLAQNLTVKEIAAKYEVGMATINRLLKKYDINKSNDLRKQSISKTKQNKTIEEKLAYSQKISAARKGKGIGVIPWNKDKKGLQVAWNKGLHTKGKPRTQESLEKAKQTNLEKYGVEWACQRKEARLKGQNSFANTAFENLLISNNISYSREFPINHYSYDFKIDNYLIEIDPYATHNSTWGIRGNPPKDKYYHQQKSAIASNNGYHCIHIFDWDDSQKIIFILNKHESIMARKCSIKEVSIEEARQFINKYHIQNYVKDDIRIGLFLNTELISIMTFGKPRYNKNYEYEILRYCSCKNVTGGSERLFTYFIKKYSPKSVISYCDNSKFNGSTYIKLGFILLRLNRPSCHWYNPKTKQHFTDSLIRQLGVDKLLGVNYGKGTSNKQILLENNFVQIYDCGQATYIWKKDSSEN